MHFVPLLLWRQRCTGIAAYTNTRILQSQDAVHWGRTRTSWQLCVCPTSTYRNRASLHFTQPPDHGPEFGTRNLLCDARFGQSPYVDGDYGFDSLISKYLRQVKYKYIETFGDIVSNCVVTEKKMYQSRNLRIILSLFQAWDQSWCWRFLSSKCLVDRYLYTKTIRHQIPGNRNVHTVAVHQTTRHHISEGSTYLPNNTALHSRK
jgi:hypothetical protein